MVKGQRSVQIRQQFRRPSGRRGPHQSTVRPSSSVPCPVNNHLISTSLVSRGQLPDLFFFFGGRKVESWLH